MPDMDYSKLRGRIVEKFGSIGDFAEAMGKTKQTLSALLGNKQSWTQENIMKACDLLDIGQHDVYNYFFTKLV